MRNGTGLLFSVETWGDDDSDGQSKLLDGATEFNLKNFIPVFNSSSYGEWQIYVVIYNVSNETVLPQLG